MSRVIGLAGWSGSGKTTLLVKVIPVLVKRGLNVATIKHAHHAFDVDKAGKDSYEHRKAGASEVLVSSAKRWVQMHELGAGEPEATLAQLLLRMSPCDLVVVEGFKTQRHPKLEVFRQEVGKPALHPTDKRIVAVASDKSFPDAGVPVVDINDVEAVADILCDRAEPLQSVVSSLTSSS
ncbi:MAG TPA: molybdopterin-guanine dinucleotide biosynthesis protein B [Steroidobacteraceae bacterium]|jgi:molybdopterin-guanine dinucleotide biosynthesis protein B